MLFSFFICYQYVASRCVWGTLIWNYATRTVVYNSRIETDTGVHELPVNKIKNILTLTNEATNF